MLDEHKLFELVGLFKKKVTLLNLFNYFEYLGLQCTLFRSSVTNMQKIRNQEEGTFFYSTLMIE